MKKLSNGILAVVSIFLALACSNAAFAQSAPAQGRPTNTVPADNTTVQDVEPAPDMDDRSDPFLQYMENVELQVTQIELQDFPIVRAFVSVNDSYGLNIGTLREQDFSVEENGADVGEIRFANRDELDLPLAIVLVVDVSGSMDAEVSRDVTALDMEKQAIKDFMDKLGPDDRVALITFSDAALVESRLTSNHPEVIRNVERLSAWGQTTLWDAIHRAMTEVVDDTVPSRRAVIVLSDGEDNKSIETPQTLLQWYEDNAVANNLGFSIYTIGLGPHVNRSQLANIANRTGGIFLDTTDAERLNRLYQDILERIQSEYLLEYNVSSVSTPGEIIDMSVGLLGVKSFRPGKYTYRSPGLSAALARVMWPGLITIAILIVVLIIATIFKISRKAWLTVMITPLEGKDYTVPASGADIGKLESCEIRIPDDPALLSLHASIRETHDGFLLEAVDTNSPIIVGGNILARKLLRAGDSFILGTTTFIFHERSMRPGEGSEILMDQYIAEGPPPLTEEAQLAGAADQAPQAAKKLPTALVAVSGPHNGERFELAIGENVIGRKDGTILLGADTQVSRKHCMIQLSDTRADIVDPGSTNGTSVNGSRCQPGISQAIFAGDTIRIGNGEYRLE